MTIEELNEKLVYWKEQKKLYEDEKMQLENERDNKFVVVRDSLTVVSDSALELAEVTANALSALSAGMVVGNNKAFEEDALTEHTGNMVKVSENVNKIIGYCVEKIDKLNEKIDLKINDINYAQDKIDEYNGYIVAEKNRLANVINENTSSEKKGSTLNTVVPSKPPLNKERNLTFEIR